MVSVGGREVCWWDWSAIVAAFEPDGEGGREGGEEETGWGNREGDVAVRSTDHRWGGPPSFTADARRHFNLFRNKLEQPDASTWDLFFYYEWGSYIFSDTGGKIHKVRRKSVRSSRFDFTRRRS